MAARWYGAFPEPKSKPEYMTVEELHSLLSAEDLDPSESASVLVVDVRRIDFEGACIKGAINLPAHSFYPTLPALLPILTRYSKVVFHCVSSNGRGPRVAGWYQDTLDAQGIGTSRAVVLKGGIRAWLERFGGSELTIELEGIDLEAS